MINNFRDILRERRVEEMEEVKKSLKLIYLIILHTLAIAQVILIISITLL